MNMRRERVVPVVAIFFIISSIYKRIVGFAMDLYSLTIKSGFPGLLRCKFFAEVTPGNHKQKAVVFLAVMMIHMGLFNCPEVPAPGVFPQLETLMITSKWGHFEIK